MILVPGVETESVNPAEGRVTIPMFLPRIARHSDPTTFPWFRRCGKATPRKECRGAAEWREEEYPRVPCVI
jgi:hypothetical protein